METRIIRDAGRTAVRGYALGALGALAALAALSLAGCGEHRRAEASRDARGIPSPCVVGLPAPRSAVGRPQADLSGCKRVGEASFYGRSFAGRTMANGAAMNPRGSNAASLTLPIGTAAKVTNLQTGKSAVVIIEDRGPYERGRLLDLSPSTAARIGIKAHEGVAPVAVSPIAVPLPDGRVKLGVGAPDGANPSGPPPSASTRG